MEGRRRQDMSNNFPAGLAASVCVILAAGCIRQPQLYETAPAVDRGVAVAVEKVYPALVNVRPILELYRDGEKVISGSSTGSGVIFREDGYVLTNFHVAGHAKKVILTMSSKERVHGEVVGADAWTDLAVIKIDLEEYRKAHGSGAIPWAPLGDSDRLEVGETVLTMGSPLALARSVSRGIVSNRERALALDAVLPTGEATGRFNTWIQTDAAVNPGNSGGPLVNTRGEVVGIISRGVPSADNLGFAIPSNVARRVVEEILTHKRVRRADLGIRLQPLQELEEFFGLENRKGSLVASVEPDSPAEAAGVRNGDVIMKIAGREVTARFVEDIPGIYAAIAALPIGETVELVVKRGDREITLKAKTEELMQVRGKDVELKEWAMTVAEVTPAQKRKLEVEDGVYVSGVKPGGPAERARLSRGDVIVSVGGKRTRDLNSFMEIYRAEIGGGRKTVVVDVIRNRGTYTLVVEMDK
jgi:serine protease Do